MGTRTVEFPANEPWVAVDWGTSRLRAWLVNADTSKPIITDGPGMNQLLANQFEDTLLNRIGAHLPQNGYINVLACGMVGAKQGWLEAPYRTTPCKPLAGDQLVSVPTQSDRIKVYIVPGISQSSPADVMRGEETLIAGLLKQNSNFSGIVCLPGTHCKWVVLTGGQISHFTTTMTGELFDLISKQSILRNDTDTQLWDEAEFINAVKEITQHPEQLAQTLFSIRANSLLKATGKAKSTARLSGLLIGCDVSSIKSQLANNNIVVVGQSALAQHYQTALRVLGYSSTSQPMDTLLLDGLKQLIATPIG